MKKLLIVLAACLALVGGSGCAEEYAYGPPPAYYSTGTVEFCDEYGCRWVTAPYYYVGDEVVYWDAHFGCWIGPHGYYVGGVWRPGVVVGYHGWYHGGYYHRVYAPHFRSGSGHWYHGGHR